MIYKFVQYIGDININMYIIYSSIICKIHISNMKLLHRCKESG